MIFCIDSDGCVFDNMTWKHETAFLPALIEVFDLEDHRDFATEVWLELNLDGQMRGVNRYLALGMALEAISIKEPSLGEMAGVYRGFFEDSSNRKLSTLEASSDSRLALAAKWSRSVDQILEGSDFVAEPFSEAEAALKFMHEIGRVVVVSQAPKETLTEEWSTAGIGRWTDTILGQEFGSKVEQARSVRSGDSGHMLLVGDAPGDFHAAIQIPCAFWWIEPSRENESWRTLQERLESLPEASIGMHVSRMQ